MVWYGVNQMIIHFFKASILPSSLILFILIFKISSVARNWINSVLKTAVTTCGISSVFIHLPGKLCSYCLLLFVHCTLYSVHSTVCRRKTTAWSYLHLLHVLELRFRLCIQYCMCSSLAPLSPQWPPPPSPRPSWAAVLGGNKRQLTFLPGRQICILCREYWGKKQGGNWPEPPAYLNFFP